MSNWDTIYITSNCHPRDWYAQWENIPHKVVQSIMRRIASITEMHRPLGAPELTWENIEDFETVAAREGQRTLPEYYPPLLGHPE